MIEYQQRCAVVHQLLTNRLAQWLGSRDVKRIEHPRTRIWVRRVWKEGTRHVKRTDRLGEEWPCDPCSHDSQCGQSEKSHANFTQAAAHRDHMQRQLTQGHRLAARLPGELVGRDAIQNPLGGVGLVAEFGDHGIGRTHGRGHARCLHFEVGLAGPARFPRPDYLLITSD